MLLTDEQIEQRIESPANLMKRLAAPVGSRKQDVSNVYMIDKVMKDIDEKLKLPPAVPANSKSPREQVTDKALGLINSAMDELKIRLPEVEKPERLAGVIRDLSQTIRNTDPADEDKKANVQFVFYAPRPKDEGAFEVIDVTN